MDFTLQMTQLVLSVLVTLILLAFTLVNRREPVAPWFAATLVCMLVWSGGSIMEVTSSNPAARLFWLDVQFFGFVPVAAFWFLTMRRIVSAPPLSSFARVVLWTPCLLILALVVANPGNINHAPPPAIGDDVALSIRDLGPLYATIAFPYVALVLVATVIVLVRTTREARGAQYRRGTILVGATLVPLSMGLVYMFGDGPWARYDPSMSALTLSAAVCGIVLWRYRLLDLAPLAHGAVIEHLADGVIVLNEYQRLVDANPSARSIFPSLTRHAIGQSLDVALAARPATAAFVSRLVDEGAGAHPVATAGPSDHDLGGVAGSHDGGVIPVADQDGLERYYSVAVTDVLGRGGRRLGLAIVFHDVTRGIDLLHRTKRLADTDDLTGLLTRRRFLELAHEEVADARRQGRPVTVMLLDLDGFKAINDVHGHAAGDHVLREVSATCCRHVRPNDLVGRYGGDEFCVLMPEAVRDDGLLVAMRLREAVASLTVWHKGTPLRVTISVGVAGADVIGEQVVGDLLEEADDLLYAAKRGGRDRVIVRAS